MPPQMTNNAYDDLSYSIKVASKKVAEKSMSGAAARLLGTKKTTDARVSVEGKWQKTPWWQRKGFSSFYKTVSAISIDGENVLNVAILYFNNGEKATLDIIGLLKVDPGYYMTKSCRSISMCRKRSYIYMMLEQQKKKQQDKNIETEGVSRASYEKGSFLNPVLANRFYC